MIRVYVITVSDRSFRGEREDITGPKLIEALQGYGYELAGYKIIPDEYSTIRSKLIEIVDSGIADIILTAGGTGFAERDVTPEATLSIADRNVPGIAEAIRAGSMAKTRHAMLSRAVAFIGPSGCSKSVTPKCIAGIMKPDSGHIEYNGKVLFDSEHHINLPPQKRHIGYLFQSYALFPDMTVKENILAGAKWRKDKAERLKTARCV